jgi:hypothetical protein
VDGGAALAPHQNAPISTVACNNGDFFSQGLVPLPEAKPDF